MKTGGVDDKHTASVEWAGVAVKPDRRALAPIRTQHVSDLWNYIGAVAVNLRS